MWSCFVLEKELAVKVTKIYPSTDGYIDKTASYGKIDFVERGIMEEKKSKKKEKEELTPEERLEKKKKARREALRTVKYFLVAGSAGAIQMGTFALFFEVFEWVHWLSYLVSLILSVLWNFTINRKFTFKAANNVPIAMLKVAVYYAVFTPLSTWWTNELNSMYEATAMATTVAYCVEVGTLLTNGITEFLYQRFFVFGKAVDSAVKVEKGEIGPYGEIYIEKEAADGMQLLAMMQDGQDISEMSDKDIKKWLKKH